MPSKFTFVNQGDRRNHIRSRRACSKCRYRKKRCYHHQPSTGGVHKSSDLIWKEPRTLGQTRSASCLGPTFDSCPSSRTEQPRDRQHEQSPPHELEQGQTQEECESEAHDSPPTPRFVSDLNPEARLIDKTTTPQGAQQMAPGGVGIWVQPMPCSKCGSGCSPSAPRISHRAIRSSRLPVSDIVPEKTVKVLSKIYFAKLHPIIPLLDEEEYWKLLSQRTIPVPLVHVVCLLAAKDSTSEKHLRLLRSKDAPVAVREFCTQLYTSLSAVLSPRTSLKKCTLMCILGLLSMHQEGPEGMEESSMCIAQAIHHAQSLAIHLPRPNSVDNRPKRIFWCLWALDRFNAATNSRPCIMADIDIAVPKITPEESGSIAFDVFFRIAKILNTVIGLYRPKNKDPVSGWDADFPGFEQIMDEMHAWQLSPSTTATLHIFYLATAILAHRLKTITTLPSPTPARLRQQLSATQVIRYMQDPDRLTSLHPFPIVVYATSLALSVSYQQLRYSRLSNDQEDARQDFNVGRDILQELRRKWPSADAMAALAHRISTALDQLPSLDLLRVYPVEGQESRTVEEENDGLQAVDQPVVNQLPEFQERPDVETMDLFSGMDDVSWMYLDAENPINFDQFPVVNLEEPYTW